MSDWIFLILAGTVGGAALLWLLFPRRKSSTNASPSLVPDAALALPAANHYRYFPQIRQALSLADDRYLVESAPPHVAKQALRERRAIARRFLKGLDEDFSNLARLGRQVARLSPVVSHEQEAERLVLSLRFQVVYAVVWLRLYSGSLPLHQLEDLTGVVGRLAARMDAAMAQVNALSARQFSGNLHA